MEEIHTNIAGILGIKTLSLLHYLSKQIEQLPCPLLWDSKENGMQPWPFCTQPAAPATLSLSAYRFRNYQAQAITSPVFEPTPAGRSKAGTPAALAARFDSSQSGTKRPSWSALHLPTQPFHVPGTWHPPQGCCLPCNRVIFFPKAIYSTISDGVFASIFHAGVSLLHKTPVCGTQLILACALRPTVSGSSANTGPLSLVSALDLCLSQHLSGTAVKP